MKKLFIPLLLLIFSVHSQAQINKPAPSPRAQAEHQVSMITVNLDYGQPGVKGRDIYGSMIPYGKVWRTGANSSTKIKFSGDVELGGNKLPAGEYALYSIPGEKEWTIIIHDNTKLWGAGNYDPANDIFRFKAPVTTLKDFHETFSIGFEDYKSDGANMVIHWENTKVTIPVFVDADELIFADINEKLVNSTGEISAATYFDSALFYFEKNKDLKQALAWVDKAVEMRSSAFWYIHLQAEISFALKQYDKAKTSAETSLKIAKENAAGDFGYIAKNEILLEKIKNSK